MNADEIVDRLEWQVLAGCGTLLAQAGEVWFAAIADSEGGTAAAGINGQIAQCRAVAGGDDREWNLAYTKVAAVKLGFKFFPERMNRLEIDCVQSV